MPTVCSAADGETGCCVGNVLYYCTSTNPSSTKITTKNCATSGEVCGWNGGTGNSGYYDCVSGPVTSGPSGSPIACQ